MASMANSGSPPASTNAPQQSARIPAAGMSAVRMGSRRRARALFPSSPETDAARLHPSRAASYVSSQANGLAAAAIRVATAFANSLILARLAAASARLRGPAEKLYGTKYDCAPRDDDSAARAARRRHAA